MVEQKLEKHSNTSWGEDLSVEEGAPSLARCSVVQARAAVPYQIAVQLRALPLGIMQTKDGEVLVVAGEQARLGEIRESLRFRTGFRIRALAVSAKLLSKAIFIAYCGDEATLEKRVSDLKAMTSSRREMMPSPVVYSEAEIPSFLRTLIDFSYAQRASDIHLAPTEAGTVVSLRVDGELREREDPVASPAQHEQLVRHLKVLAQLDPNERARPQDGRIEAGQQLSRRAVRVSVMPTIRGERIVLRLGGTECVRDLDQLGLDGVTLGNLQSAMGHDEGAILLSGSTGSGKTTTLYAMVTVLRQRGLTVSSVENPVEVELPGVAQTELNPELGLDYPSCLRSILRQDPDVIMLGELRDEESAHAALQVALSGHLVLSTVHAANPFQAITRLEFLGVKRALIGQALRLVVTQRLLPRLCPRCRVTDLLLSQKLGFEAFRAVGCASCYSQGVTGRALVAESLLINDEVQQMILDGDNVARHRDRLSAAGLYVRERDAIERLVRAGDVAGGELQAARL